MKNLRLIWIASLAFLFSVTLRAQNFYVMGGTVHTATGEVIKHAAVIVENGMIAGIVDARAIKVDPNFGPIIQLDGQHIYPGIIAAYTTLGLNDIDYMRQTWDYDEVGDFTPNIRSLVAYNTDSRIIPTVRSNGILYAQIVPEGGLISGASSVVSLQAWNWEDAVVKDGDGIHLWWPKRYAEIDWGEQESTNGDEAYDANVERIRKFLERAKAYLATDQKETDLVLAAMKGVFEGDQNLYVHVHGASEIVASINLIEEFEIPNMVIVGGAEASQVLDLLKEKDIPVMLTCLHKLPPRMHNDVNHWYKLPAILHNAGIRFCLSYADVTNIGYGSWEVRSLPFVAGTAAAFGLDKETALASITKNVAEILGLKNVGTIEDGKEATFIISEGDFLDMRTSKVSRAWIKGVEVDLNDLQKELYEKFRGKYVREGKLPAVSGEW